VAIDDRLFLMRVGSVGERRVIGLRKAGERGHG
jgi:hypothetical protein